MEAELQVGVLQKQSSESGTSLHGSFFIAHSAANKSLFILCSQTVAEAKGTILEARNAELEKQVAEMEVKLQESHAKQNECTQQMDKVSLHT